jgi:gliding motility-associated-like protein
VVTVTPKIKPAFDPIAPLCSGSARPVLPTTSTNGVTGSWSPAVVDSLTTGTYVFTPDAGQCAEKDSLTVTVNPIINPTFDAIAPICQGAILTTVTLPITSTNGVTGTWNPSSLSSEIAGDSLYVFTPSDGQCADTASLVVTVTQKVKPAFNLPTVICSGANVPALPTTSENGIQGTWLPSVVDNQIAGKYTFTPDINSCAEIAEVTISIAPDTLNPTFDPISPICLGSPAPQLQSTSNNGIVGSWLPAVIDSSTNGTYEFTPNAGNCARNTIIQVVVNPKSEPKFNPISPICAGSMSPLLLPTSNNGVVGSWLPSVVDSLNTGTYVFTPSAGQCAETASLTVKVVQIPSVNVRRDTTLYHNAVYPGQIFEVIPTGSSRIDWLNSNSSIGLRDSGVGNLPAFTAINIGAQPVTARITIKPTTFNAGCVGNDTGFLITVLPLNRDIFIPNVFTPNGDGKNDVLMAYGNYITKIEMRIFNQWGQLIKVINNPNMGWDGTHNGKPQPVGVYVYTLRGNLADGTEINKKGSITLLR